MALPLQFARAVAALTLALVVGSATAQGPSYLGSCAIATTTTASNTTTASFSWIQIDGKLRPLVDLPPDTLARRTGFLISNDGITFALGTNGSSEFLYFDLSIPGGGVTARNMSAVPGYPGEPQLLAWAWGIAGGTGDVLAFVGNAEHAWWALVNVNITTGQVTYVQRNMTAVVRSGALGGNGAPSILPGSLWFNWFCSPPASPYSTVYLATHDAVAGDAVVFFSVSDSSFPISFPIQGNGVIRGLEVGALGILATVQGQAPGDPVQYFFWCPSSQNGLASLYAFPSNWTLPPGARGVSISPSEFVQTTTFTLLATAPPADGGGGGGVPVLAMATIADPNSPLFFPVVVAPGSTVTLSDVLDCVPQPSS